MVLETGMKQVYNRSIESYKPTTRKSIAASKKPYSELEETVCFPEESRRLTRSALEETIHFPEEMMHFPEELSKK
jgi:hypothetical protein